MKTRYNPLQQNRQEKTRSLEIPSKLDIDRRLFSNKVTDVDSVKIADDLSMKLHIISVILVSL